MDIRDYQVYTLPLLRALADGQVHQTAELNSRLAKEFNLTEDALRQRHKSGDLVFVKTVAFAGTHLYHAGLIERVSRGEVRITPQGKALVAKNPKAIDRSVLKGFAGWSSWIQEIATRARAAKGSAGTQRVSATNGALEEVVPDTSPDEAIERAHDQLVQELANDLLARVKALHPRVFERVVLDLLVAMGYGARFRMLRKLLGRVETAGSTASSKRTSLGWT